MYDFLVIRFGEIFLKGRNKKVFALKLEETVRAKLQCFPNVRIKRHFDDIEVRLNGTDDIKVKDVLEDIFGIHTISAAIKVDNDLESIKKGALKIAQSENPKTFKISARRKNKQFPTNADELNHLLGGYVLANNDDLKVDVHHPDLNIRVEVGFHETRIYGREYRGAGGLPVGTSGKVLLMLSGGIDSPVAGYLMQKRGAVVEAIHFQSPPYTSDRAKQKVIDLAGKLQYYGGTIRLHLVPFTDAQIAIRDKMPENYRVTIMRRMMIRIAEKIAGQTGALAIATGESLGQVASQTLESMNTINEVTNLPILRPLISMDKIEIMAIAQRIGTYDISIRPYEDCCTIFLPASPKTRPDREHADRFETFFDVEKLVDEAVKGVETLTFGEDDVDAIDDLL